MEHANVLGLVLAREATRLEENPYHAAMTGETVLFGGFSCSLALSRISFSTVRSRTALSCEIFKSQTFLSASEPSRVETSKTQLVKHPKVQYLEATYLATDYTR